jgi:fructose-bisphosphate aldolase, class I
MNLTWISEGRLMERFDKGLMKKISNNGKYFFLALDQGLEHGPSDFNSTTIEPSYIIDLSRKMKITGLILHKGLAMRYFENYSKKVPLIVKLNGKTNLVKSAVPFSAQLTSVKEAVNIGASAVGYTVFVGSGREAEMLSAAGKIEEEAREYGLPFIIWSYPRGSEIKNPRDPAIVAYAARVALEIGADIAKVYYTGDRKSFANVVKAGGRCKIIASGGDKVPVSHFLKEAKEIINAGGSGMAVGRNIWQHEDPVGIANSVAKIIFDNNVPEKNR